MICAGGTARVAALLPAESLADWNQAATQAAVVLEPLMDATAAMAAAEMVAAVVIDAACPAAERLASDLGRRHPGLPVLVVSGQGASWGSEERIAPDATILERALALRLVVEDSLWFDAGRGLSAERAQLLARVRSGVLARLSEHLTVALSHADLLAPRLGAEGGAVLERLRGLTADCGRLVRETQAFAGRRQAVRCDLAALVEGRRVLYAVCAGSSHGELPATVAEGPLWVDLTPAKADLILLRLVRAGGHAELAMRVTASPREVQVELAAELAPDRESLWTLIADEVAAHGGRAERATALLRIVLPRDAEADRQDDLLPHHLHAEGEGDGLVEAPHRRG